MAPGRRRRVSGRQLLVEEDRLYGTASGLRDRIVMLARPHMEAVERVRLGPGPPARDGRVRDEGQARTSHCPSLTTAPDPHPPPWRSQSTTARPSQLSRPLAAGRLRLIRP